MIRVSTQSKAFTASVDKALSDIDLSWRQYPGLILTGSHDPMSVDLEGVLKIIKQARESGLPTLGLCFGLELAVIEFSRNVFKWKIATSEELNPDALVKVIDKLPEMRVGVFPVGKRMENHWHQYKVHEGLVPELSEYFEIKQTESIVEEMRLKEHPFFVLTQYHPEYASFPDNPHPLLVEFIKACKHHHKRK